MHKSNEKRVPLPTARSGCIEGLEIKEDVKIPQASFELSAMRSRRRDASIAAQQQTDAAKGRQLCESKRSRFTNFQPFEF